MREATSPVTLFTTGSLRDVAAAYNREPELLRRKVGRLYANIGNPATGHAEPNNEYNVQLDAEAYVRIMNSDLPVYWCPCFDGNLWQRGRHGTYWKFTQADVLDSAPLRLQNWFLFALIKPPDVDPIAYLTQPQDRAVREVIWKATRNMWCTAPLLHAAGRDVYARGPQDFVALPPAAAQKLGLADRRVEVFAFVPMKATAVRQAAGSIRVQLTLDTATDRRICLRESRRPIRSGDDHLPARSFPRGGALNSHSFALCAAAAFLVGFSKTGLPGASIPAVALMAEAFRDDTRLSVGRCCRSCSWATCLPSPTTADTANGSSLSSAFLSSWRAWCRAT